MPPRISVLLLSCGVVLGAAESAMASGKHTDDHPHDDMHQHARMSQSIGKPGKATAKIRIVQIDMADNMRFTPAEIRVKAGETVRFVVSNSGQLRHEMMLGTAGALQEHSEMMKKFPGMEHAEPNTVSLDPGGRGEIVWTFPRAGKVDFACLQPGHYEAGMKGQIAIGK